MMMNLLELRDHVEQLRARLAAGDVAAVEKAAALVKILSSEEETVLRMFFGWGCEREHSAVEVAQEFEVSRSVIYRLRKRALNRMGSIGVDKEMIRQVVILQRGGHALFVCPVGPRQLEICSAVERLIEEATISRDRLLDLSPREFEEFIAGIWNRFGYAVELTARTRDGGRDVVAIRKAESEVRYIIECKRYAEAEKVGVALVRALYGVKTHEGATKAFLATTSSFTRGAIEFWDSHQWELELKDYEGVREWATRAAKSNKRTETGLWLPS
jgi:hypothetical protein